MQEIIREEFEQEDASALAACLCQTLHSQFEPSILPQELDEELVHAFYASGWLEYMAYFENNHVIWAWSFIVLHNMNVSIAFIFVKTFILILKFAHVTFNFDKKYSEWLIF